MSEKATFAAGCFWGVEKAFSKVKGILSTTVGYTGGVVDHPTYQLVCSGGTGHAEAVEVEYDPSQISYEELLELFWSIHNPTTENRQGADIGSQYRSAIFFHTEDQKQTALQSKDKVSKTVQGTIVTEIVAVSDFWKAEEHHQRYFEKNRGN